MKYIYSVVALLVFISCAEKQEQKEELPKSWQLSKTIDIDGINPIGMTITDDGLWLSDGDHNRLVLIDREGKTQRTIDSLERPMHIASEGKTLFVPQYGNDEIAVIGDPSMQILPLTDSLDAPAGISSYGKEKAIADFYNHRILYTEDGESYISFGKEGKAEGDFYYPTDVQITNDKIWVADAYNNRIQVFDKKGNFLKVIGADQKMNAATGIFVSETEVFITDYENNRVLVFDHDGVLQQKLTNGINNPTEMILDQGQLYITNFRTSKLLVFDWAVTPEEGEHDHDHDHD
ncbi:NHL repeat-containing protein [Dokdonia sp.]|uniref:NHL repeat-containing protein n=1 Tax=Dokdonia sp. TaxID=2024995 RepID=UPI00326789E9